MKPYMLKQREIPYNDDYNIIVVGGGPSGCAAAIAAARAGSKTLLIEATGSLGGMGTSGLVPAWCPFSDGEKLIFGGIAKQIMEELKTNMPHVPKEQLDWVPIDAERLKVIYDDEVSLSGADVLFHTALSAVETDGGRVTEIVVTNKAGLSAYKAVVFIDCTGDGDLAVWAGAEHEQGDDTGTLQPATHCFVLSNIDSYAYQFSPELHPDNPDSPIYDIVRSGMYPMIDDVHLCSNFVGPDTVGFNAGHLYGVDGTKPESVSQALMKGRKLARAIRDGLAEFCPAVFGNAFLVQTGALLGVRETRRITGEYRLTVSDYMEKRSFDDEICRNAYYLDVHTPKEESEAVAQGEADYTDFTSRIVKYKPGESHGVPYRCLIPKRLSNVLVAGRAISADREVNGSLRIMPVCLALGEAAGTAANMAVQEQGDVRGIDVSMLRQKLRRAGAWLPKLE